jgi:hypothetical protein
MPRKGYQSITLKDEVIEILDSLGGTRSDTLSKLILQHKLAFQRTSSAGEGESIEALIAHIKERLPEFNRQQAADLIVAVLSHIV